MLTFSKTVVVMVIWPKQTQLGKEKLSHIKNVSRLSLSRKANEKFRMLHSSNTPSFS